MIVWGLTTTSSTYLSPKSKTETWWSGYDNKDFHTFEVSSSTVTGEQVGLYLNTSSVSLPEGWVHSEYRNVIVELKEEDDAIANTNETARKYKGNFYNSYNGVYKIQSFGTTYTNTDCIETNALVELYIRMYVDAISGDTNTTVPEGIFKYRYWVR